MIGAAEQSPDKKADGKSSGDESTRRTQRLQTAFFGGREKEIREIAFCMGESEPGSPWNFLVTGSAGLGKTRLIDQLATEGKLAKKWAWIRLRATRAGVESRRLLLARLLQGLNIAAAGILPPKKAPAKKGGKRARRHAAFSEKLRELAEDSPDHASIAHLVGEAMAEQFVPAGKKGLVLAVDDAHLLGLPNPDGANRLQEVLELALRLQTGAQYPVCLVLAGLPKLERSLSRCSGYRQDSFRRIALANLSRRDVRRTVRNWADEAGLKAEIKPYARDIHKTAGGNPRMLELLCEEIFFALKAHPARDPQALLEAAESRVKFCFFEAHWQMTTERERELLRHISGALDEKGGFALQDLVGEAGRRGSRLTSSNAHQILTRLEQKDLLYVSSHGKYRLAMPWFDDFIRRL